VDFAENSPLPEPQEALEDIYAPPAVVNSTASSSAISSNSSPNASSYKAKR
jgi:hypothetical protein